ncbi:GNAT family N-acetyltransferase [Sphingobacterium sp. DR205]|uniref:GNAT family N-acetyltransferase n=1 Tax=Sphingobacterium sp. DR205 TaxID=2713573 RepID=UPI0019D14A3E|nr:GNAT family N-acetyltransferase [Sphingobacterium sp. DR205]
MTSRKRKMQSATFPAISFDKVLLFHKARTEKGISAFECSFLLGKHDFFIRDAENPFKSTLIDPEDSVHLGKVLCLTECNPNTSLLDLYKLEVEESKIDRKRTKRVIYIKNEGCQADPIEITVEDKEEELETTLFLSTYEKVQSFFRELIENGYFDSTRTALEIFNTFRSYDEFGPDFHPRYLIQNIRYFINKKSGEPLLDSSRTNLFSRRLFFKPLDFKIESGSGTISESFTAIGINTFQQASKWVSDLDYRRNHNKNNKLVLFDEQCGTCSTKHALLKLLADENENTSLKLILGIFKMNGKNTLAIKDTLERYKLKYIPEAHSYFRTKNYILDFTGIGVNETKFELDLLNEVEINPDQISEYKVQYHRNFLSHWIEENKIPYSLDELWKIREGCIRAITLARLELDTERLHLRPFRKEDGAVMYALNDDIDVLRYTGDTQFEDIPATEEFLVNYDQYERFGVGRMIVTLKETGEILGWCGLKYHPELNEFDIGYRFFKKYWGMGFATESAQVVLADGLTRLNIRQIVGRARIENTASIHVLEKLGLKYVKNFEEDGESWALYAIDNPELS